MMRGAIHSSETSIHKQPYGITSKKTAFFIVSAVKTSNLTIMLFTVTGKGIYKFWQQ
jgi:hypothetical protein